MIKEQVFYAEKNMESLGKAGVLLGLLGKITATGYVTLQICDVTKCIYSWREHGSTDIDITKGFFRIQIKGLEGIKTPSALVYMARSVVANWRNGRGGGR